MRQRSFDQLCELFQPIDPYVQGILLTGFQLADTNLASGPHILLAALRWDGFRNYLNSLQRTRDVQELQLQLQRPGLANALRSWVELPCDFSDDQVCTYGLHAALVAARSVAGRSTISLPLLLRTLMIDDVDILTIVATLGSAGPSYTPWPSQPYSTQPSLAGIVEPLYLPTRREASVSRRYATRHHIQMGSLLNELGDRRDGQIVLVRGPFGSPTQRLEYVLADILIDRLSDQLPEKIADCRHVFMQSVSTLHAAGIDGANRAVANLHHSLTLAKMWHGVLILTRGEDLLSTSSDTKVLNEHLLAVLSGTGNVPVVIIHEDSSEFSFRNEVVLPFVSCRVVEMPPYTGLNTLPAIRDYYFEEWKTQGIAVSDDALDVVLQLDPAIYAPSTRSGIIKRKVLPYSAIELLQEAVQTVRRDISSGGQIRALALTAKQRIEAIAHNPKEGVTLLTAVDILDKVIQTHAEDSHVVAKASDLKSAWQPRCEILLGLPERLQRLADRPAVDQTLDGTYLVSQDIVAAQLFADPSYHLRLVHAFEESAAALDPHLLTLIADGYKDAP